MASIHPRVRKPPGRYQKCLELRRSYFWPEDALGASSTPPPTSISSAFSDQLFLERTSAGQALSLLPRSQPDSTPAIQRPRRPQTSRAPGPRRQPAAPRRSHIKEARIIIFPAIPSSSSKERFVSPVKRRASATHASGEIVRHLAINSSKERV